MESGFRALEEGFLRRKRLPVVSLVMVRFAVCSNGGEWLSAWRPPDLIPAVRPHGANAFCIVAGDGVVLISNDGERWGWPGGRPERDECWEQPLRREVVEETCFVVRLLTQSKKKRGDLMGRRA